MHVSTLQNIIDNKNLSAEEKEKAVNQMVQMTETAEKESAAESLLAAKGFHNSVVSITDARRLSVAMPWTVYTSVLIISMLPSTV